VFFSEHSVYQYNGRLHPQLFGGIIKSLTLAIRRYAHRNARMHTILAVPKHQRLCKKSRKRCVLAILYSELSRVLSIISRS